ncbi:unnamed protein product [Lactuca saligna]|uniref:Uncharacterized protein n=1 Tax=Lactuca saligna TaxID=75948 RepID=A0AA35VDJ9_LACSI|nr:unnamed protein product [Lactuca saligna]
MMMKESVQESEPEIVHGVGSEARHVIRTTTHPVFFLTLSCRNRLHHSVMVWVLKLAATFWSCVEHSTEATPPFQHRTTTAPASAASSPSLDSGSGKLSLFEAEGTISASWNFQLTGSGERCLRCDKVEHDDERESEPEIVHGVGSEARHVIRTTTHPVFFLTLSCRNRLHHSVMVWVLKLAATFWSCVEHSRWL